MPPLSVSSEDIVTAFVGWLARVPAAAPGAIRDVFANAAGDRQRRDVLTDRGGLCLWSAKADHAAGESNGLSCTILGDPMWLDHEISALAARNGAVAALAEAYRRWDVDLLQRLYGSFAFAVVDTARDRVLIAIDRMGIRSMCYARDASGGLVFGTTADLVASHPAISATISPQAVYDFLWLYVSPAPRTIWREIDKLGRAQFLLYERGSVRLETYWRLVTNDGVADEAVLADELRETLGRAVTNAVHGEEASDVGAFLSGGIDSSTVVGYLGRASGQPVQCFTIGFDQAGYDEVGYAESSARHFGAHQVVYYLTPADVVAALPHIACAYDEPFGNSSAIPTYFCAKVAREHGISLMLAGDGGDELFGGNERYVKYGLYERYARLPTALRERLLEPIVAAFPNWGGSPLIRKAKNFIRNAKMGMPRLLYAQSFLCGAKLDDLCWPEFVATIDPDHAMRLVEAEFNASDSKSQLRRMMYLDLQVTLADNDLRKVGRMCALAGVRVRYPFLDDDLVALSGRIPETLLCKNGQLRFFYKSALREILPPSTLAKQKHGFGMPFFEWSYTHGPLRELICDMLARFRRRGYLYPSIIDRICNDHRNGRDTNYSASAWDIMMLELWFDRRPGGAIVNPLTAVAGAG